MIGSAIGIAPVIIDVSESVEPVTKRERDRDYLELKRRITQAGLLDRQYL